jgi:hypothetical protein
MSRPRAEHDAGSHGAPEAEGIAYRNHPVADIDFAASFDSLDIMEKVMRHFYLRALIERMGVQADWNAVDSLMQKALAAAEKVARYRHAQLSAVRLAGDINATVTDNASLDELLAKIKDELRKLGPLIDLEAIREPQGSRTEGQLDRGESNHRARLAFKGLGPAGCPVPACVRLRRLPAPAPARGCSRGICCLRRCRSQLCSATVRGGLQRGHEENGPAGLRKQQSNFAGEPWRAPIKTHLTPELASNYVFYNAGAAPAMRGGRDGRTA